MTKILLPGWYFFKPEWHCVTKLGSLRYSENMFTYYLSWCSRHSFCFFRLDSPCWQKLALHDLLENNHLQLSLDIWIVIDKYTFKTYVIVFGQCLKEVWFCISYFRYTVCPIKVVCYIQGCLRIYIDIHPLTVYIEWT